MKLLFITQTLDEKSPVLGFVHRWVARFAESFETVDVIALSVGEHNLSKNVSVHSLGKEEGGNTFLYALRFYNTLGSLRNKYDAVFVHMNPEYVVLAGWLWKLAGKKVALWYNHTVGSVWLKIAQPFTDTVFHTSPFAYTARYKNAKRMPAGIDTDVFKPQNVPRIPKSLYFQGRVAPAKRVHVILEAFEKLYAAGDASLLTIVGPEDEAYTRPLKAKYADLIKAGAVVFKGPVKNTETPALYSAHTASVNLTDRGNYDKTVLESLACGTAVITSSEAFKDAPVVLIEKPEADRLAAAFRNLGTVDTTVLVQYVRQYESLPFLAERITAAFSA